MLQPWITLPERERERCLTQGIVPADYPGEVAEDWPELLEIVYKRVKPERDRQTRDALRNRWWQYADKRPGLYSKIRSMDRVLVTGAAAVMHHMFAVIPPGPIFSHKTIVFALPSWSAFASIQSAVHELWSRQFGTTFGSVDALTYNPTQVFQTFPFPPKYENDALLSAVGQEYCAHRAAVMVAANEGMTKTYNRFHRADERSRPIQRLRELHDNMDRAVLQAYGWDDLADELRAEFLTEETEDDHTYQGRYFWNAVGRDRVLSRLLTLNAERHAEEVRWGIAPKSSAQPDQEDDAE
jgi:hypothetical protein